MLNTTADGDKWVYGTYSAIQKLTKMLAERPAPKWLPIYDNQ